MIIAKMGERTYEFQDRETLAQVRAMYFDHHGDQNSLETVLEDAGIEFTLEMECEK
jgi:hypothetical protein